MRTYRLRRKITLEEEEALSERLHEMMTHAFNISSFEKVEEVVDRMINLPLGGGDTVTMTYTQEISVGILDSILGEIRAKEKKGKVRK